MSKEEFFCQLSQIVNLYVFTTGKVLNADPSWIQIHNTANQCG